MKKQFLISALFCSTILPSFAQKVLELSNPLDVSRNDELIVIKRSDLKNVLSTAKPYLSILNGTKNMVVQYDDLNGDGIWDEAVFLYSFKPSEKISLKISAADDKLEATEIRAHVRHKRKNADHSFGSNLLADSIPAGQSNTDFTKAKLPPFLTEGPAWENDKVGFRLYFDVRNGKDIWGKTTTKMMMDTVGVNPEVIYHHKADWGMDIYKVGSSLSAGALAINLKLKNGKDSLIRLGGKNMGKVIYQRISDGPFRAKFRLYYPQWKFAEGYEPMALTEEISIWGGQYFYQSDVKVTNAPANYNLVTGFANLFKIGAEELENKNTRAYYSFGLQSENQDNLGLAVMAPRAEVVSFGKTSANEKDVKDSYLAFLASPALNKPATFRFYSAWQPSDQAFSDKGTFKAYLSNQAALYGNPIIKKWR